MHGVKIGALIFCFLVLLTLAMLGNSLPLNMCVCMCASQHAMAACQSNGFLTPDCVLMSTLTCVVILMGFTKRMGSLCN